MIVDRKVKPSAKPLVSFLYSWTIPKSGLKKVTNKSCNQNTNNEVRKESRCACGYFSDQQTLCIDPCIRLYHKIWDKRILYQ